MSKEKTIIEAIFIASAFFALVAGFVISYFLYFKRRKSRFLKERRSMQEEFSRQLLQSRVEVQESTFASLGKELHDNIGQLLGTAKMLIGVSQRNLAAAGDTIRTADETLGKAIFELRNLSKSLNKEWLEQFSLKENLHTAAERVNAGGKINVRIHDHLQQLLLGSEEQLILFRIVQEAMQNAVKHAAATAIDIRMNENAGELSITVEDNGTGFTATEERNGVGMLNMKQRISLLNGNIQWVPQQQGTMVLIQLPDKAKNL
jgi:signal transduction histidine kinase